MNLFSKEIGTEVPIIAEIGVNHEGDIDNAMTLLRLAADAGADAVKFQCYTPERYISASDPERFDRVTRFALGEDAFRQLAKEAKSLGVAFLSTAVSEDWVELIAELSEAVKIASGDLTFEPVIRRAAKTGKPVILSTGGGTLNEIDRAVEWVREEIGGHEISERLVLMHCVSAYPTPIEEANIRCVTVLKERYGVHVGYSNHVIGLEACMAATALGAEVLEVHFTDCKHNRTFRDHALSFEPDDMRALVEMVPRIRSSLGTAEKHLQPCEIPNIPLMRKGIVAARDLETGSLISAADIMFARPIEGFSSQEVEVVIGQQLRVSVKKGDIIRKEVLR